jgi:hypothetical protein
MIDKNILEQTDELEFIELVYALIRDQKDAKKFREDLTVLLPQLENEIITFTANADCSCKDKIKSYAIVYKDKVIELIINFVKNNNLEEYVSNLWENAVENANVIRGESLSGKVAKTTVKEWEQFAQEVSKDKYFYRGFSIIKEGDDLLVFFL